jgi:hypothetical protein
MTDEIDFKLEIEIGTRSANSRSNSNGDGDVCRPSEATRLAKS